MLPNPVRGNATEALRRPLPAPLAMTARGPSLREAQRRSNLVEHLFLGFRRSPPELPSNPGPPLQRQVIVPISFSAP
jgi:hypothetical protein